MRTKLFLALLTTGLLAAFALPAAAQDATIVGRHKKKAQQEQPQQPTFAQPDQTFPVGAQWTVSEINGKPVPGDAELTLSIDGNDRGTGFSGCNTWSSTLKPIQGQRLAMGSVALTSKTCPPAVTQIEHVYLGILHSGPYWSIDGSDLIVKSQYGVLRFKRGI
ncbi:META domain-containing protein [Methylovirgula sp. 4M-Z18]|uniref:META domain-containing protein n=1 Tax=Methylovirgula sp. 4M-Z18 TaxID=2293567 RepID=UPI001314EAA3|nr:META domain-containing protein [Methylovirgula sp. 4M-Z18]